MSEASEFVDGLLAAGPVSVPAQEAADAWLSWLLDPPGPNATVHVLSPDLPGVIRNDGEAARFEVDSDGLITLAVETDHRPDARGERCADCGVSARSLLTGEANPECPVRP